MLDSKSQVLSGWGRYPLAKARVFSVESIQETQEMITAKNESSLARGLGRSYGDAAISSIANVLSTNKLKRVSGFDNDSGVLRCEPGLSFEELLCQYLEQGWFSLVTPGTKFVTMGGALASDVHGKNHCQVGSFVDSVKSFKLLTASGDLVTCSRELEPELFWATAGGMGLTGFVSELEIQMRAIETDQLVIKKKTCRNLEETIRFIDERDEEQEYSVSWLDGSANGPNLGRSILMLARHARRAEVSPLLVPSENQKGGRDNSARNLDGIIHFSKRVTKPLMKIPFDFPSGLLNNFSISLFNSLYHLFCSGDGNEHFVSLDSFFYQLDAIEDWNRIYGSSGFIQHQCCLPRENIQQAMEEILQLLHRRKRVSSLIVFKKLGDGHGLLSFPQKGYTLTLDFARDIGIQAFTGELDALVIKYGGRVYLAKDACMSAKSFRQMYDQYPEWLAIKKAIDPGNQFQSDLSVRLHMNKS